MTRCEQEMEQAWVRYREAKEAGAPVKKVRNLLYDYENKRKAFFAELHKGDPK